MENTENQENISFDVTKPLTENNQSQDEINNEALSPLEVKPLPGILNFFPQLIKDLHNMGCNYTINTNDGVIYLSGFYKNGDMKVIIDNTSPHLGTPIYLEDKRGRTTEVKSIDDIVKLNFTWWKISNNNKNAYVMPERPWLDKFIENQWVRRKIIFEPIADETD